MEQVLECHQKSASPPSAIGRRAASTGQTGRIGRDAARWLELWAYDRVDFVSFADLVIWGRPWSAQTRQTRASIHYGIQNNGTTSWLSLAGLERALAVAKPNDQREIVRVLMRVADTMTVSGQGDGCSCFKLVVFPIISILHGRAYDHRAIEEVLASWDIADPESRFILHPRLLRPDALAGMGLFDRRLMLEKIVSKRPLPRRLELGRDASGEQPAYIVGAISLQSRESRAPLLERSASGVDMSGAVAMLAEILAGSPCFVDIAKPECGLWADDFLNFKQFQFIVDRSGVRDEFLSFVSEAAACTNDGEVHAEIVLGDNAADITLRDGLKNILDIKHISLILQPISTHELIELAAANAKSVKHCKRPPLESVFARSTSRNIGKSPRRKLDRSNLRVILGGKTSTLAAELRKNIEKTTSAVQTT